MILLIFTISIKINRIEKTDKAKEIINQVEIRDRIKKRFREYIDNKKEKN